MNSIWVYDNDADEELFSYQAPAVPRVGEFVEYSFAAHDEATWAPESWAHHTGLRNKTFVVLSVCHAIRRNSISSWGTPRVTLYVRES